MSTRAAPPRAGSRPRPPVDPRMRERWVAVRRAEGRRRLRVLLLALSTIALLGGALVVAESPLLDVDRVVVTGAARVTSEEVAAVAGVRGDAMVWVDGEAVARRVETMPWIRSARLRREWPGIVTIAVRERTPVAWVAAVVGVAVVDRTGRVLVHADAPPPDLPELTHHGPARGVPPPGATVEARVGARVAGRLKGLARAGTRAITVGRSGVVLSLVDGPELRLGRPTRVMAKVRSALAVLAALDGAPTGYIDVSVPSNPVAGPSGG